MAVLTNVSEPTTSEETPLVQGDATTNAPSLPRRRRKEPHNSDASHGSDDAEKVTITFVGDAARAVRGMAEKEGTTPTELARRGLFLMDVYLDLDEDQELVIFDKKKKKMAFLKFPWNFAFARR